MKYIQLFQSTHGLSADGLIGKMTLQKIKSTYKIPTDEGLAQFMGNADHESGGFEVVTENLNYSAQGLLGVFPKYFNATTAAAYARQPEKIANRIYANRMGNGTEQSGDGWKFRGRGLMQTTGKTNYAALSKFLNVDVTNNPDLVASTYFFDSAIFYFNSNSLWKLATTVDDAAILKVRKAVNGGTNGLAEVNALVKKYYAIIKKP
ncbi:glycoside hydrolase family 19 protein [Flavobacterium sp. 3HN19-14]|uniref:glycoside hydrolase family 19 protein n=1 Tax=Flavobacterium sp. 3HN19-14 TaxID=3448133 RepID=UPI003EE07AFD